MRRTTQAILVQLGLRATVTQWTHQRSTPFRPQHMKPRTLLRLYPAPKTLEM
jgi:hypothetical protein